MPATTDEYGYQRGPEDDRTVRSDTFWRRIRPPQVERRPFGFFSLAKGQVEKAKKVVGVLCGIYIACEIEEVFLCRVDFWEGGPAELCELSAVFGKCARPPGFFHL